MCPSDSGSIRPSPVLHGASDHSLISRGTKTTTLLTKRILHLAIITYVVSTYDKKKKKNPFRSFWPKIQPFWTVITIGTREGVPGVPRQEKLLLSAPPLHKVSWTIHLWPNRTWNLSALPYFAWHFPTGATGISQGGFTPIHLIKVLDLHPYLSELQISP